MGTICASGAVIAKAGTYINSIFTTGWTDASEYEKFILEAESFVCDVSKYDWVTNYASLDANKKYILNEVVSSLAAMQVIRYDLSGFPRLLEAQTRLDVLSDRVGVIIKMLEIQDNVSWIN